MEMEGKWESGRGRGSRKEKRKEMKKKKRKERRKEMAEKEWAEEEARLNDPEEQRKMLLMEQQEAERIQRDRIAFEERERDWISKIQQQSQSLPLPLPQDYDYDDVQQQQQQQDDEEEDNEEEGRPPQIIWQGNEIIVKKRKATPNRNRNHNREHDGSDNNNNRPTSNPFPPESQSLSHASSAVLESVAQQVPNFGTEQDKAHCPFHLKTGACRFGQRCSRVHFYPDKSSTLLIKNMYSGPGLAWDQDEGLERFIARYILVEAHDFRFRCFYLQILALLSGSIPVMACGAMLQTNGHDLQRYTDEEVECCFEEFYEDVHTEFLKFGEIVNFKVCKNGSFHLRGNVYVQYKLLDSALLAYNSVNGRYFAGKQVSCKFVNLSRWKVAICGEYMKSGYKTCSHGTACNFIHCFRNPGGDYEWADSDKPPPKYWVKKMAALFGYSDDYETLRERGNSSVLKNSSNVRKTYSDRYHSRRSRSREMDQLNSGRSGRRKQEDERKQRTPDEERNTNFKDNHKRKCRDRTPDTDSDREWLEEEEDREKHHEHTRTSSFNRNKDDNSGSHEQDSDVAWDTITRDNEMQHGREGRNSRKWNRDNRDWIYEAGSDGDIDRERHHSSQRKWSRHKSRNNSNVTDESESDKDRGEMETQHDYSRKSSRHRRRGLQDFCKDYENKNDKVDERWSQRESDRRAHHHKKKRVNHQKKLESINGDTKNVIHESSGGLSSKNSSGDRHRKSKGSDNHL